MDDRITFTTAQALLLARLLRTERARLIALREATLDGHARDIIDAELTAIEALPVRRWETY